MRIHKTISEFTADREPPVVAEGANVADAVEVMRKHESDCVLVVDDAGRLRGIFTERDFLYRVAAAEKSVAGTRIADVMTAEPEVLRPEDGVNYAINRMAVGGYRNVPIMDPEGRALANLSVHDVMMHLDAVFADLEEPEDDAVAAEWTDIGGGG